MIEKENSKRKSSNPDHRRFRCALDGLKIVDKAFKPEYLLRSCPNLRRLYIDWQEEFSLPPFRAFHSQWFFDLLSKPKFSLLCSQLQDLEIVFPSAHSPNNYSLPMSDSSKLFQHLFGLKRLCLEGAGKQNPVCLHEILKSCPALEILVLKRTSVHVQRSFEVTDLSRCIHTGIRTFRLLGDMSSLVVNEFMIQCLVESMPGLRELEIQPETILGYSGLTPTELGEFSALESLERLSIPLSMKEYSSNMPDLIYRLKSFKSLKNLVLSWGRWSDSYDTPIKRVRLFMTWLKDILAGENVSIRVELCYRMHPELFA